MAEPALTSENAPDPDHWVELRVHGVSGTPPEEIMLTGFARQVAGDQRSRSFRPADSLGNEQQQVPGRTLEAYHWGRFTSGSWTQALWLLIIPFGVVNMAAFTLPRTRTRAGRWCTAIAGLALRTIGLGLTLLLIFSGIVAGLDLFAWQAMQAGAGGGRRWWLVAGAALPAATVGLFYVFGQSKQAGQDPAQDRTNQPGDQAAPPRVHLGADGPDTELAKQDFFGGDPDAPALRRLHAAASLHMVAALLLWPSAQAGADGAIVGRFAAVVLLGLAVVTVAMLGDPRREGGTAWWHTAAAVGSKVQLGVAILLVAFAGAAVALDGRATSPAAEMVVDGGLPGIAMAALALLALTVGALVVLLGAVLGLRVASRPAKSNRRAKTSEYQAFGPFAHGFAPFLLAAVGTFLGVGFAAAFSFAAQTTVTNLTGAPVTVTRFLQRVAYAWGLTILELVALATIGVVVWRIRRPRFLDAAAAAYRLGAVPPHGLPASWEPKVGRAMYLARLKNAVPLIFTAIASFGLLLSLVAGFEQIRMEILGPGSSDVPWVLGWLSELNGGSAGWVVWVGASTLSGLALALIVLGRGALLGENARRGVNIIWDVVAFWPRAVHPFVPPPYSQHVVAGLRRRISWHLGTLDDPMAIQPAVPASRVVVAAHSQGTLITAAALLWLTPAERARVGLLTCGSQLQVQFARAFPTAINTDVLHWMWTSYGQRWRNLYRDTDPIAGPVLSWHHRSISTPDTPISDNYDRPENRASDAPLLDEITATGRRIMGPDWRLLDPPRADTAMMSAPMALIRGHDSYPADPEWDVAVRSVLPAVEAGTRREVTDQT